MRAVPSSTNTPTRSVLAGAFAIVVATAAPALAGKNSPDSAQNTATVRSEYTGARVKEKYLTPYSIYVSGDCSGNSGICSFQITQVPARRRLYLKNTSCSIETASGLNRVIYYAGIGSSSGGTNYVTPVLSSNSETATAFLVNNPIEMAADAGDKISFGVSSNGDIYDVWCRIAGEMAVLK